ncbi:bifunctional DNA primase/polymerase [Nocardia ninae]|uniref:DNA primase/polymerase bifunctional N-terminal domain-containing protein n=1 Tax=Nocardia ninae NBRC 108245 TaxID=1210091 RepID=A0A511MUG7_9NOCA|nr:bifunctional DNA primase/polymerase [Nocardia ninae]GEM44245.1 hypothetical protein NN4_87640 [Nocardia ninae NBRC 108245]
MSDTRLRDSALAAARRGWFVFPLRPRSKKPAIQRWEQQATTNPSTINAWWPENSTRNVGIACGPSHLYVLDLDNAHSPTTPQPQTGIGGGRDALEQLADTTGHPVPVPTYTVATPSGGAHLYYLAPVEPLLRNSIGRLGPHIDTRGHGGYVVAAGSSLGCGDYRLIDTRTPIPLPDWLTTALITPPPPIIPTAAPRDLDAYVAKALDNQTTRVRTASTGTRHRTLLLAANSLGRLVGRGLLTHHDAYTALYNATTIHIGTDQFTQTEAERTISDGLDHGASHI